mgnify:CR=1 FL=1
MNIVKTWKLFLNTNELTEADVEYLRGCCSRLEVKPVEFPNLLNQFHKPIPTHTKVFAETRNEKQESMLLLKYSNKVTLMTVMNEEWDGEIYQTFDGMQERL